MAKEQSAYGLLIQKLDRFIRKYYLNQLIRGNLYFIGLTGAMYLFMALLESQFYFSTTVRTVFLGGFIGIAALALFRWILLPAFHYFKLGSVISREQAAEIVGNHFSEIEDRLLNVLQLNAQSSQAKDNSLIRASIDQKAEEIQVIPFRTAIDLGQNRKYLPYALPPLLLLFVLLLAAPSLIRDSTTRLIQAGQHFEPPAPFHFKVEQEDLNVVQFEDFTLDVRTEGEVKPEEAYIEVNGFPYQLRMQEDGSFTHRFNDVDKDQEFHLYAGKVRSRPYTLEVVKKPSLVRFEIRADYPAYTGRTDESFQNTGDLVVPEGTDLNWLFETLNTEQMSLSIRGDTGRAVDRDGSTSFSFHHTATRDFDYKIYVSNRQLVHADSVRYFVSVVQDKHPAIRAEQIIDSTSEKMVYFTGRAEDDYGLTTLRFRYRIKNEKGAETELQSITVPHSGGTQSSFEYLWNLDSLQLKPGDELFYFFEVYDNDRVNGPKSSRTGVMTYRKPTLEEYEDQASENNEEIKDKLSRSLEESRKIKEDIEKLRNKIVTQKELKWQDKNELEKLMNRQKELEKQIREARENFEENKRRQNEYSNPPEETLEKQKKLDQLFDEMLNDEMKDLMKKIQDLMQELQKDQAFEMMEQFQNNSQEMELELDRMKELFKQLEMERDLQRQIEKLDQLAEEQEQLSEKTKKQSEQVSPESPQDSNSLEKEQDNINEQFEDVTKDMEDIRKKNDELNRKKDLGNPEQKMEEIQEQLDKSMQQLQQNQKKKASESQKKASEKMREMSESMSSNMQGAQMQQTMEDLKALRQLLENIVSLSFDQEDLMETLSGTSSQSPRYNDLMQDQFRIKDDFQLVEDSLHALSKRVFQLQSFISEKVNAIHTNMKKSLDELEERQQTQATGHQQRTMKNLNDLALMLSESMQQMQQQLSGMMSGSQMCQKPKPRGQNGKKPMDKISQGQKQLNEEMKNRLQQSKQKGQQGISSEQFAKMAAKQAALRKMLRDLAEEKRQQGQGDKRLQELQEMMDAIEKQLVNKQLTNEMTQRQQEIVTRLLEAEKAEREREWDPKRKAETAEQQKQTLPPSIEEYLEKRRARIEELQPVSPTLHPHYRSLVERYYRSLNEE